MRRAAWSGWMGGRTRVGQGEKAGGRVCRTNPSEHISHQARGVSTPLPLASISQQAHGRRLRCPSACLAMRARSGALLLRPWRFFQPRWAIIFGTDRHTVPPLATRHMCLFTVKKLLASSDFSWCPDHDPSGSSLSLSSAAAAVAVASPIDPIAPHTHLAQPPPPTQLQSHHGDQKGLVSGRQNSEGSEQREERTSDKRAEQSSHRMPVATTDHGTHCSLRTGGAWARVDFPVRDGAGAPVLRATWPPL